MKKILGSRRDQSLAKLTMLLVAIALVTGVIGCDGDGGGAGGGDGGYNPPPSENLEIRTWSDLDAIRDNQDGNHTLMNDLDSTTLGYGRLASDRAHGGKGWDPIMFLRGSLDGQGYEIRDLFINRPDDSAVGLLAGVGYGGIIQDVGVVNAHVTGGMAVGGLVGMACDGGTLRDCYFTGSVTGDMGVGCLVGWVVESIVSNSHYDYEKALINGEHIITVGALSGEDFDQWLANDKSLDIKGRLFQEDGYYLINNIGDFKQLLAFGQNDTLKFRLTSDLDLGHDPNFYIPYLAGGFDGNGHEISNLSFSFDSISQVGLFGCLSCHGEVTEVGVENVNVTGASSVGGLVGVNWGGAVSDCYATGRVTGRFTKPEIGNEADAGGLVGLNHKGTVNNSYFTGSVSGNHNVGGLVGFNCYGNVSNSQFSGSVGGTPSERVGGLVGFNAGTISGSHSVGNISGFHSVGGLVGAHNDGTVNRCYSTCNATGHVYSWVDTSVMVGYHVGGLIGSNHGPVSGCYCTGTAIGTEYVGGLAGLNTGAISDSYSTGSASGDSYVGSLVGVNHDTVDNSYSTGRVTGRVNVGGVVGGNDYDGTVSDSFWNTETAGQVASDGGTGKTTAEMKTIATFSDAGWNITAVASLDTINRSYIWNIVDGVTYPFLSWQD
jgi:hypothetical protein